MMKSRRSPPFVSGLNWRINLIRECVGYFRYCRNWREVIETRRRKRTVDRLILRNGQTLYFEGDAIHALQIFREIWVGNEYFRDLPKGYRLDRIVDIGGHFGFFSVKAYQMAPNAKIDCYEPAAANAAIIRRNLGVNKIETVSLFQEAVSEQDGPVNFDLGPNPESGRIVASDLGRRFGLGEVTSVRIEKVLSRVTDARVNLLKMDCEGSEYAIVSQSKYLLADRVDFLSVEFHDHKTGCDHLEDLVRPLEGAGFSLVANREIGSGFGVVSLQNKRTV